jgi:hypothetical protein
LIEFSSAHLSNQSRLLHQVVTRGGKQPALGDGATPMTGAANALHGYGNGTCAGNLANQVYVADVDPELKRCGGDEDLNLAALEASLGIEPQCPRERSVVRSHVLLSQPLAESERNPLDEFARVDENERRSMAIGERGELVEDLVPHGI